MILWRHIVSESASQSRISVVRNLRPAKPHPANRNLRQTEGISCFEHLLKHEHHYPPLQYILTKDRWALRMGIQFGDFLRSEQRLWKSETRHIGSRYSAYYCLVPLPQPPLSLTTPVLYEPVSDTRLRGSTVLIGANQLIWFDYLIAWIAARVNIHENFRKKSVLFK